MNLSYSILNKHDKAKNTQIKRADYEWILNEISGIDNCPSLYEEAEYGSLLKHLDESGL